MHILALTVSAFGCVHPSFHSILSREQVRREERKQ